MAVVRQNQSKLTDAQWAAFIAAIDATHGSDAESPAYRAFVQVHVDGMVGVGEHAWGVHSMPGMEGRNFLAWHRQYLVQFERRLQRVDGSVALPYWDWLADREVPRALSRPTLLRRWSVERGRFRQGWIPTRQQVEALFTVRDFEGFQRAIEQLHNNVHGAVGGTMGGANSPGDPLFWLHHANVDRIWAQWQRRNPSARPRNSRETLEPRDRLFGVPVAQVLSTQKLGYRYA